MCFVGYFQYRQAADRKMMGNVKAVEKGKLLLESERVEALSIQCQNEDFFVTGFVRAAMKKKVHVVSNIDIMRIPPKKKKCVFTVTQPILFLPRS